MADTQTYYDSTLTGAELDGALKKLPQIDAAVEQAGQSVRLAQSWAEGGTGSREGEDLHNARYWCSQAQTIAQGAMGWYADEAQLKQACPTGSNGQWAIVGSTDTIWTWDGDTGRWVDSGAQMDLSNYYTKAQADAAFSPTGHTATGTAYGHVKLSDTAGTSDSADGVAATPRCVQKASEIQPGDTITVTQVCAPGLVTTAGTQLYMSIPLPKPVSDGVSAVRITAGRIAVRGDKGYVIGSSTGDASFSDLNVSAEASYSNVRFIISGSGAYNVTNNTPVIGYIVNTTLQFS